MSAVLEWLGQMAFTGCLFWFAWLFVDAKVRQPYKRLQAKRAKAKRAAARKRSTRRAVKVKM